MAEYFMYHKVITCKLDRNNLHILKTPKVLPCGNTACLECIEKTITKTGQFKCNFDKCQKIHYISDVKQLVTNIIAEDALHDNLRIVASDLKHKLEKIYLNLKNELIEEEKIIENIFNLIDNDIYIRLDSIKYELEKLQNDLLAVSKTMRQKFTEKVHTKFQMKEQNYKQFNDNISKAIEKKSLNDIDNEELLRNIYDCQEFLNELNNFNMNFYEKLKKISFVPSKWLPVLSMIGEIIRSDSINLEKMRTRSPRIINFDGLLKSVNRLCNFNDEELFITGNEDNKVIILDNYFRVVKEVNQVQDVAFASPLGICCDNLENVYLCDYGNHRILIVDRCFTKVKKIIGKLGSSIGEFVDPIDICFFSNCLYVLDREIKRIQEFTRAGDFIREIRLYELNGLHLSDRKLLSRPVRLGLSTNTIAVLDSFKRVYVYNMRGEFKQMIESNSNMLMCLISEYLFTCNREGLLVCFQRSQTYNYAEFSPVFERYIDIFKSSKSYMNYFDDHLVLLLADSKSLALL